MGYAEKNLAPGESIVYRARYHWIHYKTSLLLFGLGVLLGIAALYAGNASPEPQIGRWVGILAAAFLLLAAASFLVRRIRASADEYVVTNRRVIRKYGLIAHEVEQALIEKIQDVTIRQSFFARILGYGTVVLETASETGRIVFPNIAGPEALRNALWGQAPAPPAASAPAAPSARDRLAELDDLKRRGLLSQEEYSAKRKEIVEAL